MKRFRDVVEDFGDITASMLLLAFCSAAWVVVAALIVWGASAGLHAAGLLR